MHFPCATLDAHGHDRCEGAPATGVRRAATGRTGRDDRRHRQRPARRDPHVSLVCHRGGRTYRLRSSTDSSPLPDRAPRACSREPAVERRLGRTSQRPLTRVVPGHFRLLEAGGGRRGVRGDALVVRDGRTLLVVPAARHRSTSSRRTTRDKPRSDAAGPGHSLFGAAKCHDIPHGRRTRAFETKSARLSSPGNRSGNWRRPRRHRHVRHPDRPRRARLIDKRAHTGINVLAPT